MDLFMHCMISCMMLVAMPGKLIEYREIYFPPIVRFIHLNSKVYLVMH